MLFFQFVFVLLGSLMASPSSAVPTSVVQRDDAASFPELSFVDSCDRHSTAVKHFPETGKYFLRSTCQADGESHCSKIDLDKYVFLHTQAISTPYFTIFVLTTAFCSLVLQSNIIEAALIIRRAIWLDPYYEDL